MLLLGVNVRVMLRRNIDVENGLVNGAIGVITDIKHSSETRVSTIMIQFGKNTPVAITRITSEFFMKGIIVTRSQFPVSVSYAITIHKSQGLTLSSVIVSIDSDCKEPAMVYVALSRVARLSSAHLTSFEPAAIGCDQAAFVEYSRCRQTFNKFASAGNRPLLPSLPMCNTMSNEIMKERSQLFKIVSDRNIVTKLFAALKPAPEVVDCSQPVSFLPLVNTDGVSCYANSLVQILLRIPQFISKMNEECTDNATVASLHLILAAAIRGNNIGDTWPLRRSIGNPFNAPQQQDVGHFWLRILELLPSESKSRFYFQLKQILTCSKCQLHKEPTVESMSQLNFYCQDKSQSFAELYKESIADSTVYADCSRRCSKPGKPPVKTPHVLRQEIIFPHFHRHLVISLSIFQQQGPLLARLSHRKITNFTSTCVKLGPREFSTVGAVCHKGATTTSGHYTATAREDAHWLKLNDTMCTTSKRFIPNLADVCLLFLTVK